MRKRYRNPPIIEAVCEIHFDLPAPLTRDQIATMEPIWRPSLPDLRINEEKGLEVTVGLDGVQTKEQSTGYRLVARAADSSRIAQLGGHFLAVNQLKPYPGWVEGFRTHIKERLEEVQARLPIERVKQINLRYIDRLDFPETPLTWSEWFDFTLPVPSIVPSVGGNLQFHFEQNLPDGLGLVLHLISVPPSGEGGTSVVLDCTVLWRGSASLDECPAFLDRVHEPHPQIFNDFLTPRSKELFGAYDV